MRRLILASASPRRRELLAQAGYTFDVMPAHVNEDPRGDEEPIAYVVRLAREKAESVFAEISSRSTAPPQVVVLGADTTVTLDGHILAKPENAADAARMLRLLSGRAHQVITGVCLVAPAFEHTEAEITQVVFSLLSEDEIAYYVRTGEPMDKAGAYAIQGIAARWVERIEGCYFNVVGLPLPQIYRLLRAAEAATGVSLI